MTNKSPHTILATCRVYARPVRNGRSLPLLGVDETLIQGWYDSLAQNPQRFAIILKTAYEYANDFHPNAGVDPTRWWKAFRRAVHCQVEGESLASWAIQYPQIEGSLLPDGGICHARADQAKYARVLQTLNA
jgi:hypothetical protein